MVMLSDRWNAEKRQVEWWNLSANLVDRGAKGTAQPCDLSPDETNSLSCHLHFSGAGRTMAMDNTFDKTALETIDLLEARLKRIEYAICGHVNPATISSDENAGKRLADLEHSLHTLASKSKVIQELLKLRMSLS